MDTDERKGKEMVENRVVVKKTPMPLCYYQPQTQEITKRLVQFHNHIGKKMKQIT